MCSHATESCRMETIAPLLKSHCTLYFSGHCPPLPWCTAHTRHGALRMCKPFLPYQNLNTLKASPSLTHLCTLFPVHTQCLAQCLSYNQYNKYLLDGLIKTLYCLVSNITKQNIVQNPIESLLYLHSFIIWVFNVLPYPSAFYSILSCLIQQNHLSFDFVLYQIM